MLRKTSAAAAVIAFATVGSALFGGTALANGDHDGGGKDEAAAPTFTGGAGGEGGDARTVCFIVGDQTFKDKNTLASTPGALACAATGGNGGAGGPGAAEY
jgi:hypothetical protein